MARRGLILASVLTVLALGATVIAVVVVKPTSSSAPASPYRGSIPPPGVQLPAFMLYSFTGALVSRQSLRHKVAVVTFLDTTCTDACPIIASVLGRAITQLTPEERQQVKALAITVDPVRDTPQRIRRFLRQRQALGRVDFVRGGIGQLQEVWHRFAKRMEAGTRTFIQRTSAFTPRRVSGCQPCALPST